MPATVKLLSLRSNGCAHRRHLTAQPTDPAEQRDRWRPVQRCVGPLAVSAIGDYILCFDLITPYPTHLQSIVFGPISYFCKIRMAEFLNADYGDG